ncbi:MAG: ComF family protein [Lachnospiraceae bacterium]
MDWIFPRRCPICERIILPDQTRYCCPDCLKKLSYITEPSCMKCGQPIDCEGSEYCYDCERHKHEYIRGRGVWIYNHALKESIYRFKYANKREYAAFYAQQMYEQLGEWIQSLGVDAIIPIPLHSKKKRQRGYNQSELIAKALSARIKIPVNTRLLIRDKNTGPQKERNDIERKINLKNAFKIRTNELQLKKILLLDDIYTTGSTIDAAAKVLKESGALEIYFISVSIGRGY